MGLEVLRHYNVLYNEAKENKNKSNACFSRHSLLPRSYLLGRPAVDVVSLPVSSGTGPSPPGRRKGRAVHWASMPHTGCRQGSSTHLRAAQAAPALLNPQVLTAKEVASLFIEKKQMASFPFVFCQKVPVKVNFESSPSSLVCTPALTLSPWAAFCRRDKLSITNLKSKRLQNPNLWALTCYHRQKTSTPNLAWHTTARRSMLKITRGYCTVCIWSEMECYANLGVVTKK